MLHPWKHPSSGGMGLGAAWAGERWPWAWQGMERGVCKGSFQPKPLDDCTVLGYGESC